MSTQDGWTALHLAAQEGKVDVVRLLLTEAQALVNIQTKVHSHHITTIDWSTALLLHVCLVYSSIVYCVQYIVVWVCKDVLAVFSMRECCIMIICC